MNHLSKPQRFVQRATKPCLYDAKLLLGKEKFILSTNVCGQCGTILTALKDLHSSSRCVGRCKVAAVRGKEGDPVHHEAVGLCPSKGYSWTEVWRTVHMNRLEKGKAQEGNESNIP